MYANSHNEAVGVYPAIVRRAFAKLGVPVRLVPMPPRRLMKGLADGTYAAGAIIRTPERLQFSDYSEAFFVENVAVFRRKDSPVDFRTIDDLRFRHVGVIRGWAYGAPFDEARRAGAFDAQDATGDSQNFLKLEKKRLDFVIATAMAGELLIASEQDFSDLAPSPQYLVSIPIHLAINKSTNQTALLKRFDGVIASMRGSGETAAIVAAELVQARELEAKEGRGASSPTLAPRSR